MIRLAMLATPMSSTKDTPPQSRYSEVLDVAHDVVLQHHGDRLEASVFENLTELREPFVVPRVQRGNLLAHLIERRAVLEAADHLPVVVVARVVGLGLRRERRRQEDVEIILQEGEALRQHPHDLVGLAIQTHRACRRWCPGRRRPAARTRNSAEPSAPGRVRLPRP